MDAPRHRRARATSDEMREQGPSARRRGKLGSGRARLFDRAAARDERVKVVLRLALELLRAVVGRRAFAPSASNRAWAGGGRAKRPLARKQ